MDERLKELMKALNKKFYGEFQFPELEDAFLDVYLAITALLDDFLLIPLNEDVNDTVDVDTFIFDIKQAMTNCVHMIQHFDAKLTKNKNTQYNNTGFIEKIDGYSHNIYDTYDITIRQVNSENALKINNMIFAYQMLLRFFNNMLLNHSNYKGKLVNVKKPLILNIEVVDVEKFLGEYTKLCDEK